MAGLLSSWWSGKPAEEKEEKSAVKKREGEGEKENEESSENQEASWVSGLEGTCTIARNSLTYYLLDYRQVLSRMLLSMQSLLERPSRPGSKKQ